MDLGQESTPFLSSIKQEKLSPNRRVTLVNYSIVPTSNVSTNSIGISSPSTSNNQKAVASKAQPEISPSSPSPVAVSSKKPTGSQSSSPVFNVVSQSQCVRCSQLSDLNRNLLQKLSESKCKHDEEMKESRKKMEKEYELKLLEHRTNLETVKKEAEKKLDSLNLELRLQLVKSKEENISLQQENLKIIKNSVQAEKYNELKELYDKKMETCSPITDLETLKIVHNKEMKELEEKLKKEYEKKLMDKRFDLETKAKSKLDQLRKELTKFLDISIDTKAQPGKEIDKDEEVMIINESLASQTNKKKKKNSSIGPDCGPTQKKQKLSSSSNQSHASTAVPRGSLPLIERELVESNDKLGYTEIPDNHSAVRICSICRWVERICHSNYPKHFLDSHRSVFSEGEAILRSLFKELILDDKIYHKLRDKNKRDQISDEQIQLSCYKISKNSLIVKICSVCQFIEPAGRYTNISHFKNHKEAVQIEGDANSLYKTVVMKKSKFEQLKSEGKWKS
ncbi:uncharacterized protein LOC128392409 [Panonychus citri]|uniref:uncharacterized protein LOC128392409 n=1 Tax=Panonychus citri TaxID=50023 RepID=UPI002306F659|nr:uncharacterized protein LOC128392409 [Panonychus citri]